MQRVINIVLDERKKEQEKIKSEREELAQDRKDFEDENVRLDGENKRLTSENGSLTGQVDALRQQLKTWQESGAGSVIKCGVVNNYPNEVYDHIVEMLRSLDGSIPNVQQRHRQIYDDLVKSNPSSGEMQKRKDKIVEIVRNKTGLSEGDISTFERLGFTHTKEGKHHKFSMGSFCMIYACTGSDSQRGWKNSIRDFNRTFFVPSKGDS